MTKIYVVEYIEANSLDTKHVKVIANDQTEAEYIVECQLCLGTPLTGKTKIYYPKEAED